METHLNAKQAREILDEKLTELALLAKKLCPAAKVEVNTKRYEDEDGRLKVFPPPHLPEAEAEALEEALTEKCNEILEQTNLFILCAAFNQSLARCSIRSVELISISKCSSSPMR